MTNRLCEGRVCIVTGAGRGLGREYALMLAARGAKVVVNDVDIQPARQLADEIVAEGGEAVANADDISTFSSAQRVVDQAIDTYGGLDVVVNNAGILRDRMLFSMSEDEWDAVMRVHLKGTFCMSRFAAEYWRNRAKAGGTNDARLINATSVAGLYANAGQCNYGAAKAGIAAFTQIAAIELERYGVTANAIAPVAHTRMTDGIMTSERASQVPPRWAAPAVVWLASPLSADISGQVIESSGTIFGIAQGWTRGPHTNAVPAEPEDVDVLVRKLLAEARPRTTWADLS